MIAIVIPYFQKTPGLLLRAVQSVMAQDSPVPWKIIIVDDGSPVSAEKELAPIRAQLSGRLNLIRQRNQGASAARNRALDALQARADIVAFLDSDDIWEAGHLARIAAAMEAGADFYFENYRRYDEPGPRFARSAMAGKAFECFDQARELFWFEGDFFDILLRGSPAATPAVAFRFSRTPRLRFRTDLWYCEDVYFWMQASRSARRIAFSPKPGVYCGKGINISEGEWGTFRGTWRSFGHTRYHHLVQRQFPLDGEQRAWNEELMQSLDRDFWQSALGAVRRGEYRCAGLMMSYVAMRPHAVARLPPALGRAMQAKWIKPRPTS